MICYQYWKLLTVSARSMLGHTGSKEPQRMRQEGVWGKRGIHFILSFKKSHMSVRCYLAFKAHSIYTAFKYKDKCYRLCPKYFWIKKKHDYYFYKPHA